MKTPIFLLIKRLDRVPLYQRIDTVVKLIAHEKPHSIRAGELKEYLKRLRLLQLRKEAA